MKIIDILVKGVWTVLTLCAGWSLTTSAPPGLPAWSLIATLALMAFAWAVIVFRMKTLTWTLYAILFLALSFLALGVMMACSASEVPDSSIAVFFGAAILQWLFMLWRPSWVLWGLYAVIWLAVIAVVFAILFGILAAPFAQSSYMSAIDSGEEPSSSIAALPFVIWGTIICSLAAWIVVLRQRTPIRWALLAAFVTAPVIIALISSTCNVAPNHVAFFFAWVVLVIGTLKMIVLGWGRINLLARSQLARPELSVPPRGIVG